jgi:hypothetical protein
MGGLAPVLIVFLVILGAVFLTLMGYATHRTFGIKDEDKKRLDPVDEQAVYMRQVRQRHFNWLRAYCASQGIRKPPVVRDILSLNVFKACYWCLGLPSEQLTSQVDDVG